MVPVLPLLSAGVSLVLMLGLPRATWERLFIWMAIGVAFYFSYGFRNSRLRSTQVADRALRTADSRS